MSVDPTESELAGFNTVEDAATWAGLGDTGTPSPRASWFALFGLQPSDAPRIVAIIADADFDTLRASWKIQDRAPTPAQLGLVGLFRRACQFRANTILLMKEMRDKETEAMLAARATPPPSPTTHQNNIGKIKMSLVINQMLDSEIPILDGTKLKDGYNNFKERLGANPAPDEECTAEQLSAYQSIVDAGAPPYVDMSVWGPYGHRLYRKLKLTGMQVMLDGSFKSIELLGPSRFELWQSCWKPFRTASIMFNAITPARFDQYHDWISSYHRRYGRACWHLVYQADVRARQEHAERLRRRGQEEFDFAKATKAFHEFDPKKPWEWVYDQLAKDSQFWKREVEDPCLLVLVRTASLSQRSTATRRWPTARGPRPTSGGRATRTAGTGRPARRPGFRRAKDRQSTTSTREAATEATGGAPSSATTSRRARATAQDRPEDARATPTTVTSATSASRPSTGPTSAAAPTRLATTRATAGARARAKARAANTDATSRRSSTSRTSKLLRHRQRLGTKWPIPADARRLRE